MKTVKISLYDFDELSSAAKEEAMIWADLYRLSENEVRANEYLFYADGCIAHTTTFTGEHARTGQTDLSFHGETMRLVLDKKQVWECNSCGFSDYTDAVGEEELNDWLQCSNCGGNEFHLITKK